MFFAVAVMAVAAVATKATAASPFDGVGLLGMPAARAVTAQQQFPKPQTFSLVLALHGGELESVNSRTMKHTSKGESQQLMSALGKSTVATPAGNDGLHVEQSGVLHFGRTPTDFLTNGNVTTMASDGTVVSTAHYRGFGHAEVIGNPSTSHLAAFAMVANFTAPDASVDVHGTITANGHLSIDGLSPFRASYIDPVLFTFSYTVAP